jgi:hypothetical protein
LRSHCQAALFRKKGLAQQRLYLRPEPQGQRALRAISGAGELGSSGKIAD